MATTEPASAVKALVVQARDRLLETRRRLLEGRERAKARPRTTVLIECIEFQDGVDEIVAEPLPRFISSTHYYVILLFLILFLIASVVEVDVVLGETGRLITDTPTIVLQPLERGIIREIKVRPGMAVTKGQVLVTLDPTVSQVDLASVLEQRQSLLAQQRRIEAELNGVPFELGPSPNKEEQLQETLYLRRQEEYKSHLNFYDEEILRLRANINTSKNSRELLFKQLEIARDVEGLRAALTKSQAGSKLQLLEAQSGRMHAEMDFQDVSNRLLELQHAVESKQAERRAFVDEWHRQLLDNVVSLRTSAISAEGSVVKASLVHDRVVVTAPTDGVVLGVAKLSVGSVLQEAEPLVTIVPSDSKLIAEIMISSGDVGYIKVGDAVSIKMDAFPYSRHGLLSGKLTSISAESFSTYTSTGQDAISSSLDRSGGGVFYRGWIDLDKTKLENMPKNARLMPGMTMSAEIKVGSRSITSFLLRPLLNGLSESFREF